MFKKAHARKIQIQNLSSRRDELAAKIDTMIVNSAPELALSTELAYIERKIERLGESWLDSFIRYY